ncbi:MAG: PqqD family protein [Anaerolineae bacterium]|nr:MAG: PqqD family protein [Anaerolineae bacterium]
MSSATYITNRPTVVSENFDDEAIVIHMDTGVYYSLRGSAGVVWQLLEKGATLPVLAEKVGGAFGQELENVKSALEKFLADLKTEALIRETDEEPGAAHEPVSATVEYAPPMLVKYEDLQDLLLLDPIHEVDEKEGWPKARTDQAEG